MTRRSLPPVHDIAPMAAPVTVAGDVHLTVEAPQVAARFLGFLEAVKARGGTLVLLGDLFDWWVGRRQAARDAFARSILDALAGVVRSGVRIAFVQGNRDYAFDGADGLAVDIWPDVVRTRWGERTVVLSHGDLLCSADRAYLRMRGLLRGRAGRRVLAAMPYRMQTYMARGLRDLSDRATRRNPAAGLGIDYALAEAWLEGYEADLLVLGHVHTGVHHRIDGSAPRDVYVLKDWSERGNAVVFDGDRIALTPA